MLPLNRQRIIQSNVKIRSSNVSVLIKEGVFIQWKNSAFFIKIRVLFGPEISALGVFLNFDNERMHPPLFLSPPPPRAHNGLKCTFYHYQKKMV